MGENSVDNVVGDTDDWYNRMPPLDTDHELVYDRHEEAIYVETDEDRWIRHPDASQAEFGHVSEIDELATDTFDLLDSLLQTIQNRTELIDRNQYFSRLDKFQRQAGGYYERCQRLQTVAKEGDSAILAEWLDVLYKTNKLLTHYFRQLSIAQSIGFSQRLVFTYLGTTDYVFLYGFVRNACSTLEYLGKLIESRGGANNIGLENQGVNFKAVYEELQDQGLDETLTAEAWVTIPTRDSRMRMGDVGLDSSEMEFLRTKRNEIVHHCPIVVDEETTAHLPEDILTTAVLTQSDAEKLVQLASRVHLHSIGIFLQYSKSYTENLVVESFEAMGIEDTGSS
ncbi:hypothetical protein HZS55_22035 [Halosimplex rubrum]|uniref:Uncharacterized protein n=1 Tax=Halosimplex rubrum TaxID=869889 RepID=A0A7D5T2F7_9EURY|nr:hypothetical protein [Halosimplex rubrum]QLH79808.1 hypothetical protein HZS55_22035 [Halosimplex rubrum]